MKPRHVMTALLGGLVLSCQGPAAVLAQEAAARPDPRLGGDSEADRADEQLPRFRTAILRGGDPDIPQ